MKETLINFRATKAERDVWHVTAQTLGTSISEICREALDRASKRASKLDNTTHGPAHDQQ